ncbi:MAG: glucans biosynthesis glucosyltransferase MdoH, partial [Pseudomonadota bacterium]
MDGTSNLAIQYVDDYAPAYAPSAPEREHLPAPSALAMPKQPLGREGVMAGGTPATSPADIRRRRIILFTATFAMAALASWVPVRLYAKDGFMPLEVVGLALFEILILAISCWFCSAVAGLVQLIRKGDKDELAFAAVPPRPTVRTALLMPLYNEDAQASFARLAQIERSLSRLGVTQHFDLFVLSDSTDERAAAAEWAAFGVMRSQSNCRVYYRRRRDNS